MATVSIQAVVLKEITNGESNKYIVVLAKEHGKMLLSAKGAKKEKSKFLAGTQLFSYCDFLLSERNGFYTITDVDLIESFYPIRQDLMKFSYSSYLAELIEKTVPEGLESDQVLTLFLKTLNLLSKTDYSPKLAARIFELKYLQVMGLMPEMDQCSVCKIPIKESRYFSAKSGGLVCQNCSRKINNVKSISSGVFRAMEHTFSHDGRAVFGFELSNDVLKELTLLLKEYISLHINETFKTLQFVEKISD